MMNMARKDTLATPCILLRERLLEGTTKTSEKKLLFASGRFEGGHSLFQLLVHGQDGGVAHEGEGQDGNGVDGLRGRSTGQGGGVPQRHTCLSPSSGGFQRLTWELKTKYFGVQEFSL